MIRTEGAFRRRQLSLALGTSVAAWCFVLPAVTQAQCAPDPTVRGGITTCTGVDADGVRVTTAGSTLIVAADATVTAADAAAVTVDVPKATETYVFNTVDVQGRVLGGAQNGIAVYAGTPPNSYSFTSQSLALTVVAGASVSGTTALSLISDPNYPYARVYATVDNSGTLTGTGGTAIATGSDQYQGLQILTNQAAGRIVGQVSGSLSFLNNAGTVDGGALSAISAVPGYSYYSPNWINTGTIRSASVDATLTAQPGSVLTLTNSGTIANGGAGAAITAGGGMTFTNTGTVTGNVVTTGGASTVDSTGGTINGSLTFGNGNDTLVARYAGTRTPATGVTGAIDGGGGINTERVTFAEDATVAGPIDLATGFQRLGIAPAFGTTVTLGSGFATNAAVVVSGGGSIVNRGTIATAGQAVTEETFTSYLANFSNEGTISGGGGTGQYAVVLDRTGAFSNSGAITSSSAGVAIGPNFGTASNSGTINSVGTGLYAFDTTVTNSGRITSTGGTGLYLFGNVGFTSSNSGTISGATVGAQTGIYLTNTGTIGSAGLGVQVDAYGYLVNAAGGVVNGGRDGAVTASIFNSGVVNAGTINGDVTLRGVFADANMAYVAQTAGVLNGNLSLGSGATLVTDLANTGAGTFAGITGTVTAGSGSTLRYRVGSDANATLGPVGPFASAGYELNNGATLTLTAATTQTRTLVLAGTGTVDVDAAIATTDVPALLSTTTIGYPGANSSQGNLAITSRGALSGTYAQANYYGGVVMLGADSFTNAGTISLIDRTGYSSGYAILGGASVTNAGAITLDGGTGIGNASAITNTGTITQMAGGAAANGVALAGSLTNSGTISVAGRAVLVGYSYTGALVTVANSGTLASTGGAAIGNLPYSVGPASIVNLASGTISGTGGRAIELGGGTLSNAGTITGTVDLGYATQGRAYASGTYEAEGGTIAGDLLFGSGQDLLLQTGDTLVVSGIVDGGDGSDTLARVLTASGTVALDLSAVRNFENVLVAANGADAVATITGPASFDGTLYVIGDGQVVNQATIAGMLTTQLNYPLAARFGTDQPLASLTNAGSVAGGVSGSVGTFVNTGTVGSATLGGAALLLSGNEAVSVTNSGTISSPPTVVYGDYTYANGPTVELYSNTGVTVANSGRIGGSGMVAGVNHFPTETGASVPAMIALANSGTITSGNSSPAARLYISSYYPEPSGSGTITVTNSGTISAAPMLPTSSAANGLSLDFTNQGAPATYSVTNTGTISAIAAPAVGSSRPLAIALQAYGSGTGAITNAAGGTISASGARAFGVVAVDHALTLDNAGTISAVGTVASYAVVTAGAQPITIRNTGTITGAIDLDSGADRIDNAGTITGAITLQAGDDAFIQRGAGRVTGLVDGGDGVDGYTVDSSGGATLTAAQIANFETVTQIGTGTGTYSGSFGIDTIALGGGTLSVAAEQTLATTGATTVTGTAGSGTLSVTNAGTIAGAITLADSADIVSNFGTIGGPIRLGAGNDTYVEGVGSVARGDVDGGTGVNLYLVILAGDRTGIGARANFQDLAVDGSGTLSLALDQTFNTVALGGTSLSLALGGYTVGQVTATGPATQLTIDGDVGAVQLGGGNDTLASGAATLAGRYDGGAGNDTVRFTSTSPVVLAGSLTGFETADLAGDALTISGSLGAAGQSVAFTGGDKSVTVARGGVLAGSIDLGAGNNSFRLAAGGTLAGTVNVGSGATSATLDLAGGDYVLRAGALTGFQRLVIEGAGTLTLTGGAFAPDTLSVGGQLTVATDASLATRVAFGPADNRFVIAGGFAGAVDGAAGTDSIDVSGGSAAAPVAFSSIVNVEAYRMSGGFATIGGNSALGGVALTGGRLVGLAGSTLSAAGFNVGQGATFGSAGIVNGNLTVAGILSPGASPGTMTVNGNVSLAATSVSVFEITPTVSDKLAVNGTVSIASGATLQLVPTGTIAPGTSLDLVTATGGITGSFTNIVKPPSLFGFVVQDASRVRLLGQFLDNGSNSPQASAAIGYVNDVLLGGRASASLLAAAPLLVSQSGVTDAAAFGQLAPTAYAAARQIGVENGLTLADAARGGFATSRATPGVFTFAAALGGTRTLKADDGRGTARTTTSGYGFLGGVGFAGTDWSLGAFGGYLNDRQTLAGLGARTTANGVVAGLLGQIRYRGVGIKATVAYDGAQADTRRTLAGGSASGRYDLHSWIADASIDTTLPLASAWSVRPSLGGTVIRTSRDGVNEAGSSAFALTVARRSDTAVFVDGGLTLAGSVDGSSARVRPYLTIGARYQAQGRTPYALAGLGGGGLGLVAEGASRASVLATATLGADIALSQRLALFGAVSGEIGDADRRAAARGGLKLAF